MKLESVQQESQQREEGAAEEYKIPTDRTGAIEEEKQISVKDTPASTHSVKVAQSNMAKAESETTLPPAAEANKSLPKHPSIPEENMPKSQATEGND